VHHLGRILHAAPAAPHGGYLLHELVVVVGVVLHVARIQPCIAHQPLFIGEVLAGIVGQLLEVDLQLAFGYLVAGQQQVAAATVAVYREMMEI
jgi:hypothetical protein